MGTGIAKGEEKAILAAQEAINSPLLQDASIKGAKGLLVNITGPEDMTMHELNAASNIIYEEAGEEANVILGCILDTEITDEIQVTVIATGLNKTSNNLHPQSNRYSNDDSVVEPRFKPQNLNQSDYSTKIENKNTSNSDHGSVNSDNKNDIANDILKDDLDIPAFMRNRNIS